MTKEPKHLVETQHHNLSDTWTFHYLIPSREDKKDNNWEQFLKPLYDFNSLEDFFAILQAVEKPEKLPKGCRYYIFKKDIKPLWEDPKNVNGQQIMIVFQTRKGNEKIEKVASKWQELALMLLAQSNPEFSKNANGIEFNNKGSSLKIAIWYNKDKGKGIEEVKKFLEEQIKAFTNIKPQMKIEDIIPEALKDDKKEDAKDDKKPEEKKTEEKKE